MKIYSVYDDAFKSYGRVLDAPDMTELLTAMNNIALPIEGVAYEPNIAALEECAVFSWFETSVFGGMPTQLGMCWGHNTKLNCLEYHRDSEFNLGTEDFVLLLAREDEIENGILDTACVKAFKAPAGVLVEVYATTLHYAPCHMDSSKGFRVMVALPRGTNTEKPGIADPNAEDKLMTARNKWLLAHPESSEAASGAVVGLSGENIDIATSL